MSTVGILHPGAMGASVAAAARERGARVLWCSAGRSEASRARAAAAGLEDAETIPNLLRQSDVVISVCPPAAARQLAEQVARAGYSELYVDANAVSPQVARAIGRELSSAGASFVDGSIVGPPAQPGCKTLLYLSGEGAERVAGLFVGSSLTPHGVGDRIGSASALKMAFAGWTKGTAALLLSIRALAEAEGVTEGLDHAWREMSPELLERWRSRARAVAPKAWRWVAEMEEISATFDSVGLPGEFHRAAAETYARLEHFQASAPAPEEVLAALSRKREPKPGTSV